MAVAFRTPAGTNLCCSFSVDELRCGNPKRRTLTRLGSEAGVPHAVHFDTHCPAIIGSMHRPKTPSRSVINVTCAGPKEKNPEAGALGAPVRRLILTGRGDVGGTEPPGRA
jgi:hypothetical protein